MAEIAVVIIDPEDKRWAQLVDDRMPVRDLLPGIAHNLQLPQDLNYELLHLQTNKILDAGKTLFAARVPSGAELLFRPVRDTLLAKLVDKLYDEAKDYVKDQLWDMAKDRLKTILRLDPQFPDPAALRKALDQAVSAGRAASGIPKRKVSRQPTQQPTPPKGKGCSPGCVIASIVTAGGAVVIGGIIAVAALNLLDLSDSLPRSNDVTLGTGDVQVTLRWNTSADLDLHVIDPWQEEINHAHRYSESGGELDVDANRSCSTQHYSPVENIYWPSGGAPSGTYSVYVVDYLDCGENGYTSYEVVVTLDGRVYGTYSGEIFGTRTEHFVISFDW